MPMGRKSRYGICMWLILFACATTPKQSGSPSFHLGTDDARVELAATGRLQNRLPRSDEASLVILYGGEQQGSLDPCGCATRPRGGLPRWASYAQALQAAQPQTPTLYVNGGYWLEDAVGLDGNPRADAPLLNRWMVSGMEQMGLDALNVGYNDMAGLRSLGTGDDAPSQTGLPLVSANIKGPGIAPFLVVKRGDLTIGITGISSPGARTIPTPGFTVLDPVKAARPVIEELKQSTDLIVLLVFQAADAAKRLARDGDVDVIIDTNRHRTLDAPFRVSEALWVRSHFQTMRLGELRLGLKEDRITWAIDRKIDLDAVLPDEPNLATISKMARKELRVIERELYGRPRR
jgi:2',3'-cyclic-nucleotide 2'-phosphodiesterase (5'-nucleotidase family)